jgi:phospholipid/cholesterol/gamma-HCH transport system substrate-binding protein
MHKRVLETAVGGLVVFALLALLMIGLNFSISKGYSAHNAYFVKVNFDNVSGLVKRAPARISGVTIGSVHDIILDKSDFTAQVVLAIDEHYKFIPVDSTASIFTEGLLGAKYVNLDPGFKQKYLHAGSTIYKTHSSVILEHLISRMLFGVSSKKAK